MASSKRMRRGDGSITKREDGRYMARYMVTLPDGTRRRQAVYGNTADEARSKMRKEQADAANGAPIVRNGLTVNKYLADWIKVAPKIGESTRCGYAGVIRKHIIPNIGNVKLSSLSTLHVQQMINARIAAGVSARVAQIIKNTLSSALRTAKKQGLVANNVAREVEIPDYEFKERKIWTKQQTLQFWEAARSSKYRFIFEMLLTYGMRRGEALAIEWEDIDFEKKIIHIVKQYTIVGGEKKVCEPKTKNSKRDLPFLPHIEKLLLELKPANPTGAVVMEDGRMVNPYALKWEYKKIIEKLGLPYVTLHSLRHFAATSLKTAGVSVKDAQMILGHASPITTMQHYQHSTLEDKEAALQKYIEAMRF